MNRYEALHILGLDEKATADDIKVAYRELAQIMHPDKFQANQRLQSRATEQFKVITEAKDLLLRDLSTARQRAGYEPQPQDAPAHHMSQKEQLKVQYNAAETARLTLLSYLDAERDRRKTNAIITVVALIFALVARKFPVVALLASAMFIYGVVGMIGAHMQAQELKEQLESLEQTKKQIMHKLAEL